jgi:hypothetical protein
LESSSWIMMELWNFKVASTAHLAKGDKLLMAMHLVASETN